MPTRYVAGDESLAGSQRLMEVTTDRGKRPQGCGCYWCSGCAGTGPESLPRRYRTAPAALLGTPISRYGR